MYEEISFAAQFLSDLIRVNNPSMSVTFESQLSQFKCELIRELTQHYELHWHIDKPFKGSAFRCLRVNHNSPLDSVLLSAARKSQLSSQQLRALLPPELTLWIDPNSVAFRIGELHGSVCTVLDLLQHNNDTTTTTTQSTQSPQSQSSITSNTSLLSSLSPFTFSHSSNRSPSPANSLSTLSTLSSTPPSSIASSPSSSPLSLSLSQSLSTAAAVGAATPDWPSNIHSTIRRPLSAMRITFDDHENDENNDKHININNVNDDNDNIDMIIDEMIIA